MLENYLWGQPTCNGRYIKNQYQLPPLLHWVILKIKVLGIGALLKIKDLKTGRGEALGHSQTLGWISVCGHPHAKKIKFDTN